MAILNWHENPELADNLLWVKRIYWRLIETSKDLLDIPSRTIFNPEFGLYLPYLLAFLILAFLSYWIYYRDGPFRVRTFLSFCFPRSVYSHPSALLDFRLVLVNRFLAPFVSLLPGLAMATVVATVGSELVSIFGVRDPLLTSGVWLNFIFTFATLLVWDFSMFATHSLFHFVPLLWPLHSVHHSAEVLTPATAYRNHPLYNSVNISLNAIVVGTIQGCLMYFMFGEVALVTLLGVNFGLVVFYVLNNNLRHSHMWMSYGRTLNHLIISPASHQGHHSVAAEHRNKNMGRIFAFWDWMFGTLYVPSDRQTFTFGLGDGHPQPHPTLWKTYTVPLVEVWQVFIGAFGVNKAESVPQALPAAGLSELAIRETEVKSVDAQKD